MLDSLTSELNITFKLVPKKNKQSFRSLCRRYLRFVPICFIDKGHLTFARKGLYANDVTKEKNQNSTVLKARSFHSLEI
jgi:hypothetical protein